MVNKTVGDLLADFELKHAQKKHANERRRAHSKKIQELENQKRTLLLKKLECAFLQGDLEDFDGRIAAIERAIHKTEQEEGLSAAYDLSLIHISAVSGSRVSVSFKRGLENENSVKLSRYSKTPATAATTIAITINIDVRLRILLCRDGFKYIYYPLAPYARYPPVSGAYVFQNKNPATYIILGKTLKSFIFNIIVP